MKVGTLDFHRSPCHTNSLFAGVAQWLERRPVTPEAAGSSPVIRATSFPTRRAAVAQLVEHSTENARVTGSNPVCGTTLKSLLALILALPAALLAHPVPDQDRVLLPGDRFQVVSPDLPELNVARHVGPNGAAALPLVGDVFLAKRTAAQARETLLEAAWGRLGRRSAGLEIRFLASPEQPVEVTGMVANAVEMAHRSGLTLGEVLRLASPSDSADLAGVRISTAEGLLYLVDAESAPETTLRPGDRIYVPQGTGASEILVLGGVVRPGSLPFRAGMTLAQALEEVGGLTALGVGTRISITSAHGEARPATVFDAADVPLRRGDRVFVWVAEGRTVYVSGLVKSPGPVAVSDAGLTLWDAVVASGGLVDGIAGTALVRTPGVRGERRYDLRTLREGRIPNPPLRPGDMVEVRP
jgi:protein involved in polysaccharide export with SLBB domain